MPLYTVNAMCRPLDEFTESWSRVDGLVEADDSITARMRFASLLQSCRYESRQLHALRMPPNMVSLMQKYCERSKQGLDWVFEVS